MKEMMSSFFMIVELVDYLILFKKAMFSECVNKDGSYASPKPASSTFGMLTRLGQARLILPEIVVKLAAAAGLGDIAGLAAHRV